MELDLYIEELSTAVEYQGEQHYFDVTVYGQRDMFFEKDVDKALACAIGGIRYVEVPYWAELESVRLIRDIFQKSTSAA